MWRLGAPILCTVENLDNTYSQPSVFMVPYPCGTNCGSCSNVIFSIEKNLYINGPMQFKLVLFKDQTYTIHIQYVSRYMYSLDSIYRFVYIYTHSRAIYSMLYNSIYTINTINIQIDARGLYSIQQICAIYYRYINIQVYYILPRFFGLFNVVLHIICVTIY